QIQNSSSCAAASRVGANTQVLGQSDRAFSDVIHWPLVREDGGRTPPVLEIEDGGEIFRAGAEFRREVPGKHDVRNLRGIDVTAGIVEGPRPVIQRGGGNVISWVSIIRTSYEGIPVPVFDQSLPAPGLAGVLEVVEFRVLGIVGVRSAVRITFRRANLVRG